MVSKYYFGTSDVKKLASSARLGLSSYWRRSIQEEARQVACWMLQRHCDLSLEELQQCDVLKELQWRATDIEVGVARARQKIDEGDFSFRLGVESVEQMLLATFAGMSSHDTNTLGVK